MHTALAGGLTTKIHALVDADSLPVALTLAEDQAMTARALLPCWATSGRARPGRIEIELAGGHRVRADAGADPVALRSVIEALVGR